MTVPTKLLVASTTLFPLEPLTREAFLFHAKRSGIVVVSRQGAVPQNFHRPSTWYDVLYTLHLPDGYVRYDGHRIPRTREVWYYECVENTSVHPFLDFLRSFDVLVHVTATDPGVQYLFGQPRPCTPP